MNIVIFAGLIGLLISCSVLPQKKNVDIHENVGWLHGNCLAIKNSTIALPKTFTLYEFESGKNFSTATITEEAKSGDECYALLDDRKAANRASGYSFYKVSSKSPINLGIGFFKLDSLDKLDFDYCTTTEGIVFSISESKPTLWEEYYYLGYESEATCE